MNDGGNKYLCGDSIKLCQSENGTEWTLRKKPKYNHESKWKNRIWWLESKKGNYLHAQVYAGKYTLWGSGYGKYFQIETIEHNPLQIKLKSWRNDYLQFKGENEWIVEGWLSIIIVGMKY